MGGGGGGGEGEGLEKCRHPPWLNPASPAHDLVLRDRPTSDPRPLQGPSWSSRAAVCPANMGHHGRHDSSQHPCLGTMVPTLQMRKQANR